MGLSRRDRRFERVTGPSLREFDRLEDRVVLHRQAGTRPVLIVEGPADARFIKRMIDFEVDIFIAGTRSEVVAVAGKLHDRGVELISGLTDRDFDDAVECAVRDGTPLVTYDGADLESMLFMSRALESVLEEIANHEKVIRAGGLDSIRESVVVLVTPLAKLRSQNTAQGWGLAFDKYPISSRMKVTDSSFEPTHFARGLSAKSPESQVSEREIESVLLGDAEPPRCPHTGCSMFCGKDAVEVLAVLLRRKLGNLNQQAADPQFLGKTLRLAADPTDIRTLPFYARLASELST